MQGNDRMRRQLGVDEMGGESRDRAIGLFIGQALRCLARDAELVAGIDQRQFARLARQDAPKQRIERRRCRGLVHPNSLAWPAVATSLPSDIRSAGWLWAVLSDSIGQSIGRRR